MNWRVRKTNTFTRSAWERAWFSYGKALGQRNAPTPSSRRDGLRIDCPTWEKAWLPHGIKVISFPVNGTFKPDDQMAHHTWHAAAAEVFTQLPIDVPVSFRTTPRANLRALLQPATDHTAQELCYALFMEALQAVQTNHREALFIITDASIHPHNWDLYPELRAERFHGITNFAAGVALANFGADRETPLHTTVHEMFHLLGFRGHHDNYAVEDYPEEDCVMHPYSNTTRLCQRNRDALMNFWQGVEQALGRRFLN